MNLHANQLKKIPPLKNSHEAEQDFRLTFPLELNILNQAFRILK